MVAVTPWPMQGTTPAGYRTGSGINRSSILSGTLNWRPIGSKTSGGDKTHVRQIEHRGAGTDGERKNETRARPSALSPGVARKQRHRSVLADLIAADSHISGGQ